MKKYYQEVLKKMDKVNIKYFVGADSLVGLEDGNLFKNSNNLKIYIYQYSIVKILILFLILLRKKIVLKPKIEYGSIILKFRHRPRLTAKDKTYIKCFIMKKSLNHYEVFVGNNKCKFNKEDIKTEKSTFFESTLTVPANTKRFVQKYNEQLLFDYYIKHEVYFDSKEEKRAIKFLFDVKKIIESLSQSYWIEGGTLLGAVRDKRLIPWDHDIDLGMINKSDSEIKKLIKKLRKKFYVSVKTFEDTEGNWKLGSFRVIKVYPKKNIFFKDKLCLDIFIYYLGKIPNVDEKVYKYVVWGKNAFHKRIFFDTLEEIDFYGKKISVPSDYEKFLEVKYGPTWKTPNKKWNVALDDGSILKTID